jgi:DNA-binding beta-propeller fold protein YncE
MIRRVSGRLGLGSGSWRTRGAVIAVGLGCLTCAATASAAPADTHLSIFAGTGVAGAPTPGLATNSALYHPRAPAVDPTNGDVYIADYHNFEVEKITPNGILSIVAGTGTYGRPTPGPAAKSALAAPTGVAVDATTGDLYIADPYNNEVEKVTRQGTLSIAVGTGTAGAPTPGPATRSKLDEPYGVAVDATTGDLYIADYDNSEVEKVTPRGTLSIIAGTGVEGAATPGPATQSELGVPSDVAVNSAGDVYIADPFFYEVEKVTPRGILSIVAGTGTTGAPTPGPATQSQLGFPHGVGMDPTTGDLYIADYQNSEVEQVTPQGALSIVAGTGTAGAPTPGPATQSALDQPLGVGVDPGTGDLYIADTSNNEIERVGPACPAPSGGLTGDRVGPVALGMTRAQARKALPSYTVTQNQLVSFCLAGGPGILAGYPSTALLKTLSPQQRTRLRGRAVLALTANHHYVLDHITAGTRVARVHGRLAHAVRFRIGGTTWYVLAGSHGTGVLKVQHGTVEDVGIANHAFTATRAEERRLLTSF